MFKKKVSRKFEGCFKEASRVSQGSLREISRVSQVKLKGVSRVFERSLKGVFRSFNGVFMPFQGCLKGVLSRFPRSWCLLEKNILNSNVN